MDIKEFAFLLREELWRERNPIKVAEKINSYNFSYEEKRLIIGYIEYHNLYDSKIKNYSNNEAFLNLVSEVKRRVIGEK